MSEEKIWDAIETAINSGMSIERFRFICGVAWEQILRDHARLAAKKWREEKT